MVVSTKHVGRLSGLDDADAAEMMIEAREAATVLLQMPAVEGANLVLSDGAAAGQDVAHVHLHVIPRSTRDDVSLGWDDRPRPVGARAAFAEAFLAAQALR